MFSRILPAAATLLKSTPRLLGAVLVFSSLAAVAFAQDRVPNQGVPEIDAGTASSALALLAGGMLLLRSRLRAK